LSERASSVAAAVIKALDQDLPASALEWTGKDPHKLPTPEERELEAKSAAPWSVKKA
jgi:hypothetical protein